MIAAAILVLAVVIAIVGWRVAASHHHSAQKNRCYFGC